MKALRKLIHVKRPSNDDSAADIFHFGLFPPGFPGATTPRVQDDRAIVLVMAAVLDQALEGALLTLLPGLKVGQEGQLFSDDGAPLRDFDAKIRLAYALGLIGEGAKTDLGLIRNVRNTFAHSRLRLTFATPEIAETCAHFTLPERKPKFVAPASDPRETFIGVGFQYALYFLTEHGSEDSLHRREILDLA